jgi:Flp pilus assembly protein TadD
MMDERNASAGREREALTHFEQALAGNPGNSSAHTNIAPLLANRGRLAEAITHLEKALEIRPEDVEAHNNLGLMLAMSGRIPEATAQIETAVRLTGGKDPLLLDLLGKLYAEAGQFREAAAAARRGLAAAVIVKDGRLIEKLRAALAEYERRVGTKR